MNATLNVQSGEVHTLKPECKCNGNHLDDLWRSGRHASDQIGRLTKDFHKAASSLKNNDAEGMRRLNIFFFSMKAHWIKLNSLLQCIKSHPCQCIRPIGADIKAYFEEREAAWEKFYLCSEYLVLARINTRQTGFSEGEEFLRNTMLLKTFRKPPTDRLN